jgi:AcrR family transcriptional regulator
MHGMKSLREEHAQSTRNAILEAARRIFASHGYDTASIDEIAAAARVTSGALYHHFRSKRELMRAVFEALEAALKERVTTALGRAKSSSQALRLALRAFFDACLQDDIRSIVFEQAPRVLGWEEWRRIDAEYGIGLMLDLLSDMRREQQLGDYDDQLAATLFLAAVSEAGLQIALGGHRQSELRRQAERILGAFLEGLHKRP